MNGYGAVIDPEDTNVIQVARENEKKRMKDNLLDWSDVIKESQTATTGGRKFDGDKLRYGLLPITALQETVHVLSLGAIKYEENNWMYVPDSQNRYFDALQRHLWSWKSGEQNDPETGINHLAHAACNIMFLLERDSYSAEEWEVKTAPK